MGSRNWLNVLPFLLLISCSTPLPQLEGVDLEMWRNDKNGCDGKRSTLIDPLMTQKAKLLALSELDIVELLGRPDQNELYTRNQKFYFYFITPSAACAHPGENPRRLMIRFNAVGLAQEILVD